MTAAVTVFLLAVAFGGGAVAQRLADRPTIDIWRASRVALLSDGGEAYLLQIVDSEAPGDGRMFDGMVVSQPTPRKLIVLVDEDEDSPAGDAVLVFNKDQQRVAAGTLIHFDGVIKTFSRNTYRLTLECDVVLMEPF